MVDMMVVDFVVDRHLMDDLLVEMYLMGNSLLDCFAKQKDFDSVENNYSQNSNIAFATQANHYTVQGTKKLVNSLVEMKMEIVGKKTVAKKTVEKGIVMKGIVERKTEVMVIVETEMEMMEVVATMETVATIDFEPIEKRKH